MIDYSRMHILRLLSIHAATSYNKHLNCSVFGSDESNSLLMNAV